MSSGCVHGAVKSAAHDLDESHTLCLTFVTACVGPERPVWSEELLGSVAGPRVRFLCIDASPSHVLLGASTGRRAWGFISAHLFLRKENEDKENTPL